MKWEFQQKQAGMARAVINLSFNREDIFRYGIAECCDWLLY